MRPSELSEIASRRSSRLKSSDPNRTARTSRPKGVCRSWAADRTMPGDAQTNPNSCADPALLQKAQADFAAAALEFAFGGSQGELESWRELLRDPDPKIRLAAHKFLTAMRDGTPRKAEPRNNSRPIQLIFGPVASDHELPQWLVDPPSGTKVLRTDGTLTDFPKFPKAAGT